MFLMLLAFALVVTIDQSTKARVAARLQPGASTPDGIWGVRLRHVVNRRRQWGSPRAVRVLALMWFLLAAAAWVVGSAVDRPSAYIALGALIGGAMGNLLDGIRRHAITDFIDLRVWPVFNLADAAIVTGAMLILWTAVSTSI